MVIEVNGFLDNKAVKKTGHFFQLHNEFDGRRLDKLNLTISFHSFDDFDIVLDKIRDFLLIHRHCFVDNPTTKD